ncbi:MAG: hypothetical protein JXA69_06180 [Phycisphaerae bacterium]|nr:hypothetical protein [Phycisphaerae bacterium]
MATALWRFAEVEAVYQRLRPLSPYGRRSAERRTILTDPAELDRRYDRVDAMRTLLADEAETADRVRYHLKRIPRLPLATEIATAADLFLVKKFLVNSKALAGCLPEAARALFGLSWQSDALLQALDTEDRGEETFYLADRCSGELAAIRAEIRQLDTELQALRSATLDALQTNHGLDFQHRDFLVIDHARAEPFGSDEVYLEPFDSRHVIVRPVLPKQHFTMLTQREALLSRERQAEQAVLATMAATVREHEAVLAAYVRVIEAIDLALAAATLAQSLDMTRPELQASPAAIEIIDGRLIPLQENCADQQLDYRPLTATLETPHGLLHGSNMTGKSVVLKTVSALQILAQLGLFVPARQFRTVVFDRMSFIGTSGTDEARGLSGFGQEMVDLRRAIHERGRLSLFIIDEFARTTNSREAAALIAGLLHWLDGTDGTCSLLATHYTELPAFERVRRWQMKGVDWEQLSAEAAMPAEDLAARIKAINRCVPHEMIADSDEPAAHDAIRIAEKLGLDDVIVTFARGQLGAGSAEFE